MGNGLSRWLWRHAWASLVFAAFLFSITHSNAMVGSEKPQSSVIPGEMIVKIRSDRFAANSTIDAYSIVASSLGEQAIESVEAFKTDGYYQLVKLKNKDTLQYSIGSLMANDDIEYVEPNYVYSIESGLQGEPNDTDFEKLWGMLNKGQADAAGQVGAQGSDINVLPVWKDGMTGSRNVVVAVIDTGVDWDHPDLVNNVYTNPGEIAGNGIDDDGNGFIDDVHGWNFFSNTNSSDDDHSHGTHCSGTIGGEGNNSLGVAGVNWEVTILPVKFLSKTGGGSSAGAIESIKYATKMGVNIMSNSWGGGGFSQALMDAIREAEQHGILFVAAAGNDGNNNDSAPTYPAGYELPNIIAVAATDNKDQIATFSNYGYKTVHVAAPGVKIYSTVMGGGYDTYSGTSMATPHVSGVAALILSQNPGMTYGELKKRIITTSDRVPGLKKMVAARGRVNVYNAIHNIVPPNNDPDESLWQDIQMDVESPHPYDVDQTYTYPIDQPGAKFLRIHFEKIQTESKYDTIKIYDRAGAVIESISGDQVDYTTDYLEGDYARVELVSDYSVVHYGFKIDRVQVIK